MLINGTVNNFQRLLHQLGTATRIWNMEVHKEKTKCMIISKTTLS